MRTWIVALSLVTSAPAIARPVRICPRQASAVGVRGRVASAIEVKLKEALTERGIDTNCRDADGVLELDTMRVGSTLRFNLRLLRADAVLATGHSVTNVHKLVVVLPDAILNGIDGLSPPGSEMIDAEPAEGIAAEPVANARAPEGPVLSRRGWGWVAIGVGGTLVAAAGVTGGLALAKNNELDRLCPGGACDPADPRVARRDIAAENQQMHNLALAFDILLPVGLVTAAGGILLLTVFDSEPVATVSPWLGADGGGVVVRAQF